MLGGTVHAYAYLSIGKPVDNQVDIYSSFKKRGQGGFYISTRTLLCVFPCIFMAVEEVEILCKSRFCVYAYFKG